jgi:MFS family permease
MGRVLNRELASVIATVSLAGMAMSVLQPVLPLYLTSIGISPSIMGLMFSLGMVGMVFGESSGGWLADKLGIKIPLGIGTLISGPLVLLFLISNNVPFIFTVFLMWGVVRAGVFAPGRGYIGKTVSLAQKATYMAIYGASMSLTRSLGTFIGGFVGEHLGYDYNFYVATGIALLGGLLVISGLNRIPWKNPVLIVPIEQVVTGGKTSALSPYRSRIFVSQCIIAVMAWISTGIMGPFIPLLAVENIKVAETEVGLLFTISALVNAALLIPLGRLSDRKNKRTMMAAGLLISAVGLAGIALSTNYGMLVAALVVQSIGGALFGPAAVALLSETVAQNRQGTAMGIYGGCEDVGVVIGSALGGVIWETMGSKATFFLTGVVPAVLGAVIVLVILKNKPSVTRTV